MSNDTNIPDWSPPTPSVPDGDSIGRGNYKIDGANVVLSIGENEIESYSNKTTVPDRKD